MIEEVRGLRVCKGEIKRENTEKHKSYGVAHCDGCDKMIMIMIMIMMMRMVVVMVMTIVW